VPSLTPTFTPSPYPTPDTPPRAARLEGMRLIWQTYNGCAGAALTMMLLYHDWNGTRDDVTRGIKPNERDPSVRGIEMVAYVEAQELKAVVRTGGTLDVLRRLVAAGFPVLVENVYNNGSEGWMGHNRVVMGYDDEAGEVLTFDSVLGAGRNNVGRPISYIEFDALWQPFNRTYMVVYPPGSEARIEAILGPHWNATSNAQMTLLQAEAEIQIDPENAFALFNLGTSLLTLGQASDAVIAFERAQEIGLPWRYLWYQFGPFEAYLATGRFHETIALGERVLNTTHGVEEVYYYMGLAYAGLGDVANARRYYQDALARNNHFIEAEAALSRLPVDTAAGP
jgi:tetratricopeptide (TPR) repeat protein